MCPNCHSYLDERDQVFCSLCGAKIKQLPRMIAGGKGEDNDVSAFGDFHDTVVRMMVILKELSEHDNTFIIKSNADVYSKCMRNVYETSLRTEMSMILEIPEIGRWDVISMDENMMVMTNGFEEVRTGILNLGWW